MARHEAHAETVAAVAGYRLGLAGHAWFETFSVLTRLPPGSRRSPRDVASILRHDFGESRYLGEQSAQAMTRELAEAGIAGGSVYDALVGATARQHRVPLFSRDRRALGTYAALGVDVRMIPA